MMMWRLFCLLLSVKLLFLFKVKKYFILNFF